MPSVAICSITFRRPQGLTGLLESLAAVRVPDGVDVRVVVVDNDPEGSAGAVIEACRPRLRWPIEFAIQPMRGIPFARNLAVELASAADHIVFVDDDEIVESEWLAELLRVRAASGAPIVTGPVSPIFEREPPSWLRPFFERPRFADAADIGYARTGNVLIDTSVVPTDEPPFAERLALTGGSDTHFFLRLTRAGHRIAWADHAVVHELMPATRVRAQWVVKREYRRGNTLSLCLRDLYDSWPARGKRVGRAAAEIGRGLVLLLSGIVRGRTAALRGVQRVALGAGMVTGLANVGYREYTVIHGR